MSKVLQNYFEQKNTSKKEQKDHLKKFFDAMEEIVGTFEPQRPFRKLKIYLCQ